MHEIIIQLHKKGGGSTTNVQSYQPTEQEIRMQKQAADYAEAIMPNAYKLNEEAAKLLFGNLGNMQVDYNSLLNGAQAQIGQAQQGVAGLTQGLLPEGYQKNMENSIRSGVENTMGNAINSLGSRGVLSSSVTTKAMDDISQNASDAMAQQYQNNISMLNGLYGQQASLAGQNIATAAGAQEAAQHPALNLWQASLGLNSGGTLGALQAMGGQGTTTTTGKSPGGSGLFGGQLGLGGQLGSAAIMANCFTEDTKVRTPDGEQLIRRIKPGDKIIAHDHVNNTDGVETVVDVMKPHYSDVYTVVCEDEKSKKHYVSTTLTQPLMGVDGSWIDVAILRIGQKLKSVGKVRSIILSGERKVYDLKLTGANTYYANGFIAKGATNEW